MLRNLDPAPLSELHRRPAYQQLRTVFLERVRSGEWRPNRALPTEVELSRAFGVSVGTIRKVMDELSNLGLIKRQQGRGTFVQDRSEAGFVLFDPIRNADGSSVQWDPPRRIEVKTNSLTSEEASKLGRNRLRCDALHLMWLHFKNSRIFALQRSVVPLDTGIDVERASQTGSLGELFGEAGILVVRSDDQLTMALPDQETAYHLSVSESEPLQHVHRKYYDTQETIVGSCSSWLLIKDEQYVCIQSLRG